MFGLRTALKVPVELERLTSKNHYLPPRPLMLYSPQASMVLTGISLEGFAEVHA